MLITEAFRSYATDVIAMKNQSRKTEENHYICMRSLLIHFGDIPIEGLSFPMIRDWKLALDTARSAETVRNYVIKLRVVLAYCELQGLPVLNPQLIPVPKRTDKVPVFISQADVSRLMAGTKKIRNKCIISFLYASGIRVSELISLNRGNIADKSFTIVGKGGKARLCFIDERTDILLDLYLQNREDSDPALFLSDQTGLRMTAGGVQEIFKRARKVAGFTQPIHPHTMRHSFATNLMSNGMHIYNVQQLLGHSSIQTTQMYLHVTDPQLREEYVKHHTI
jgi:integrase/recombinase XerD